MCCSARARESLTVGISSPIGRSGLELGGFAAKLFRRFAAWVRPVINLNVKLNSLFEASAKHRTPYLISYR
jgi:hypothetical protein